MVSDKESGIPASVSDQEPEITKVSNIEDKYKCNFCNEIFRKIDQKSRHEFKHTGKKLFSCDVQGCDKKYTNLSHLKRHHKTAHKTTTDIIESIKCKDPNCSKYFINAINMRRHYKELHLIPKFYQCLNCPEQFKRKAQLKRHLFVHTGSYPHTCTICNKGFVNLKLFQRHKTTHVAEKQLRSCPDCSEKFTTWSALVNHRRKVHTVRFECEICKKKFGYKNNLKLHLKLHSTDMEDLKVFQCHYENCPKFYLQERNLTFHIKSKHEGKKFYCDYCDSQQPTKQKILQHMKMHLVVQNKVIEEKKPERKPRNPRKDIGTKKRPAVALFLGLKLDSCTQKMLLNNCGGELRVSVPVHESTTDQSDYDSSFNGN
ncbi:unnamed protein product [Diamesa serratosioi]